MEGTTTTTRRAVYSELDARRLREAADVAALTGSANKSLIRLLNRGINAGEMREPKSIPPDVVTMRSIVAVTDMTDGIQRTISIHYPAESDPLEGRISVLTPTGLALLGAVEGEVVSLEAPIGTRHLRVDKILYQPEAHGEFNR